MSYFNQAVITGLIKLYKKFKLHAQDQCVCI